MTPKPLGESTPNPFENTSTPHVFLHIASGKYMFADETGDMNNGEYSSEVEAAEQLKKYAEWLHTPPQRRFDQWWEDHGRLNATGVWFNKADVKRLMKLAFEVGAEKG